MTSLYRFALKLDEPPLDSLVRAIVGFLIVPFSRAVTGVEPRGWRMLAALLFVLVLLRIIPGVIRKLIPFPASLRAAWSERRQLAKRFDSYQWRKLTGVGIGLALYVLWPGRTHPAELAVAFLCVLAGMLGSLVWRRHRAQVVRPAVSAPLTKN